MIPHSKPYISDIDTEAVNKQLSSGLLAEGKAVKMFEEKTSNYTGINYCVATSSGVTAIHLALAALQIQPGDEVIIPSYVCDSVFNVIEQYGAKAVLCDIGDLWNMTPETVSKVYTVKTKAIILVHIFGINAWNDDFKKFGVPVIEDNCQAFGLLENGKIQDLKGDMAIYSFHATKCLATGEGGMLATNNPVYFKRAADKKANHDPFCRMTDLQGALGISQLAQYDWMLTMRKNIAQRYFDSLPKELLINTTKIKDRSMFFRFPLTLKRGEVDTWIAYFATRGIAVRKGVDAILHTAYRANLEGFDNTERTFETTLSIPIYPALMDSEVDKIIYEITTYYGRN